MVLMIVSGRSGSGKSVALRALEDMGFYCVDNLPVVLLPDLARSLADRNISAAVSIDVRNMPESPEIFEQAMQNLPSSAPALQQESVAGKRHRRRERSAGAPALPRRSDRRYVGNVGA